MQHNHVDLSCFIIAVAVFRKPNTIPPCFSADLVLNFLLSWLLVLLPLHNHNHNLRKKKNIELNIYNLLRTKDINFDTRNQHHFKLLYAHPILTVCVFMCFCLFVCLCEYINK
jgi:hypothetical protein